jgi:hypothetical protein
MQARQPTTEPSGLTSIKRQAGLTQSQAKAKINRNLIPMITFAGSEPDLTGYF